MEGENPKFMMKRQVLCIYVFYVSVEYIKVKIKMFPHKYLEARAMEKNAHTRLFHLK